RQAVVFSPRIAILGESSRCRSVGGGAHENTGVAAARPDGARLRRRRKRPREETIMQRKRHPLSRFAVFLLLLLSLIPSLPAAATPAAGPLRAKPREDRLSAGGRMAARARAAIEASRGGGHLARRIGGGTCGNEPDCGEDGAVAAFSEAQSEMSIAV